MEKMIKNFLALYESKNKKRFDITTLESYVITGCRGVQNYVDKGGYNEFYNQIMDLKEKKHIKEIGASEYNRMNPPLKARWQITSEEVKHNWDPSKILKYSDVLDFAYYKKNPSLQSDLEWEYIENIYGFIKNRDQKKWASIEERSLELFYDEKFLIQKKETLKGKYGILSRLKLTNEDLKMKRYGEMFIHWNRGVQNVKNIIILENHSTFFTYKRFVEKYEEIFGYTPDALIYGEGKKIEGSLTFLEEIANLSEVEILYFGDFDSEGLGIYYRLKARYPMLNIKLQFSAYIHLLSVCNRDYSLGGQQKKQLYLDFFLTEITQYLDDDMLNKLLYIWENDFRIPQELINYEYLVKVRE
ncbi:Wadjet anti-phage system protein JetD domain-containing protein [Alkaliphilus hydrothermalis]|uniref:Wadjet protein JetD C-terminal domain-containing protein n=1 Tax=Alkaliphilus hydrothermalis TaxID=1482730 RepID=A0ABS2NM58_9FIRM|nr:Wadjet anti-phage system protein JetD domain-containing protein [Alkaliphilus hydrothermalis]MBM7614030.1 hypothetical protein [Alkaliphilus hydrothermalis]